MRKATGLQRMPDTYEFPSPDKGTAHICLMSRLTSEKDKYTKRKHTMSKIEMSERDLRELYILLEVYRKTYTDNRGIENILQEIKKRYERVAPDKEIDSTHNFRNAGRHRQYNDADNEKIKHCLENGLSIRKTAEKVGCSAGYVQTVKKQLKTAVYNN